MKTFDRFALSNRLCRKETEEFRRLLAAKVSLKERADVLPFFRARPHLSAACGFYNPAVLRCDLLAWEYDLFGDFACDLAVGDATRKAFTFIEFEDAGPKSLFVRQGKKASREWSARLDHGYGQIIDWFYKLDDRKNSDEFEARFGKRSIDFIGLLVIGRDRHMDTGERLRFEWRRDHVVVHSKKIRCVTFDELLRDVSARLEESPP